MMHNGTTLNDVIDWFNNVELDTEQFNQVVAAVNGAVRRKQQQAAMTFRVGQRVRFEGRNGMVVEGVITKINTKTVKVHADNTHVNWKVSPSLLQVIG